MKEKQQTAKRGKKNLPSTTLLEGGSDADDKTVSTGVTTRGAAMKKNLKNEFLQTLSVPELKTKETAPLEGTHLEEKAFLKENKICETIISKVEDLLVNIRVKNEKTQAIDHKYLLTETDDLLKDKKTKTKSEKMYERYQKKWLEYAKGKKFKNFKSTDDVDCILVDFFHLMAMMYAPSTLYVIYSCVNSWFIDKHGYKLDVCLRVNKYLKQTTSTYVTKKSKVLTATQVDYLLKYSTQSSNHEDTLMGVCTALQYYGLLRISDTLKVTVGDVEVCEETGNVKVLFEHARKRKNAGFTFYIPKDYKLLFKKYMGELQPFASPDGQFLKNFSVTEYVRLRGTGYKKISKMINRACKVLDIPVDGYTGHCLRRSAATNLADRGVSFVNLKRHGQWKSDSVVEGYTANSEPLRMERLSKSLSSCSRDTKK